MNTKETQKNKIKISHECPLCLLEESKNFNDYDYALCHLFDNHPDYYDFFIRSSKQGRMIILDNSLFETSEMFDNNKFLEYINAIQPSHYIIPDAFMDKDATITNVKLWNKKYKPQIKYMGKSVGVVQGRSIQEFIDCYKEIINDVDVIAFPHRIPSDILNNFDKSSIKESKELYDTLVLGMHTINRQTLIMRLYKEGLIDETKEHHLLGCTLPQEFLVYQNYNFITSCDTSSPVIHGIFNSLYKDNNEGITRKLPMKVCDLIDCELSDSQKEAIYANTERFKYFI
jgi:hypothetical protein